MRKLKAMLVTASLLVAVAGQPVWAAGGSVTSSLTATSPIMCDGTTTVTLSIDGVAPPPNQVAVDVMLVLDRSGSMVGTPIASLRTAANSFVTTMDENDGSADGNIDSSQVGMVAFNQIATLAQGLTHDATAMHASINALTASGQTNIGDAVTFGAAQLAGASSKDVLILMTDGQSNVGSDPLTAANNAKAAGIEIFTIGLGSGVNANQLRAMATDPSHYYQAPSPDQLEAIFTQLATGVAGPAATNLTFSVQPAPGFEVTGASTTKGAVLHDSASLDWSLSELRTESVQVTYMLRHVGATGGMKPLHDTANLSYTDDDGVAQSTSYNGVMINVQGCNQPPVANAGSDQVQPQTNTGMATVLLDGSWSTDDGQIQPLSFAWYEGATLLGNGATLSVSLPLGAHTITLKVNDGQFEATDDVTITVTDPYAPTTTTTLSGTGGANDWFVSPVAVTLSAVDNPSGSGVHETRYQVDGGPVQPYMGPFMIAGEGMHTLEFHSNDNAGNVESIRQITVMIDTVAPSIAGSQSPAANAAGWNNTDVTVTFTCDDATSGLASCSGPSVVGEGSGQAVTGTAVDNAGNSASFTVGSLNIDKTAPVISVSSPMAQEYADDVMLPVNWTAGDALSGIESESATLDGAPVANGAVIDLSLLSYGEHTLVVTATDMAGNTTTVEVKFRVGVTYESLEALKHRFFAMGLIKNQGIVTSLDLKLRAARAAHERGQFETEDNILRAFIHEVEAQAGKGIWEPAVTKMMQDAQWLMDHN